MSVWLNAAAAAADIRDIRGPISLPAPTPWLWYAIAAVVASLALWGAIATIKLWHRQRVPAQSPYEAALSRIRAADAQREQQPPDVYAEQVSAAVRQYIEARFALPAAHRTSDEFLASLLAQNEATRPLAAHRSLLSEFLNTCDLAKFAARSLQDETKRALSAAAVRFIETTESTTAGATP